MNELEKGTENSLDIMSSIYPELSLTLTEKSKTAELVDYFDIRIQTNRNKNAVKRHKDKMCFSVELKSLRKQLFKKF